MPLTKQEFDTIVQMIEQLSRLDRELYDNLRDGDFVAARLRERESLIEEFRGVLVL